MHKEAYTGGVDFTQYFKDKNWMFNINASYSLVEGTAKAIENTQKSSAHFFQRPDRNYSVLDTNRTSLNGSGGRMQILKLNGHWNFQSATIWKTPGFETNDLGYIRESDQILTVLWAQYNQYDPKWIYRKFNINSDIYSIWNFGGNNIGKGYEWNANMDLKNFWSIYSGGAFRSNANDQTILRGGPMMKVPGNISARMGFTTDNRKKLVFNASVNETVGLEKSSNTLSTGFGLSFRPSNWLVLTVNPGFCKSSTELQYVTNINSGNGDKYIFASIDRKTINTSFRVNINLSPNLTLQYWGQPFFATGRYHDYKIIVDPMADEYNNRFRTYSASQISLAANTYKVDENSDGIIDYSFDRKDFNIQQFLSNLVIRWEYSPGSSVYFVWSQTRNSAGSSDDLNLGNDIGNLFNTSGNKPHNVFLVKFSYRFGLK